MPVKGCHRARTVPGKGRSPPHFLLHACPAFGLEAPWTEESPETFGTFGGVSWLFPWSGFLLRIRDQPQAETAHGFQTYLSCSARDICVCSDAFSPHCTGLELHAHKLSVRAYMKDYAPYILYPKEIYRLGGCRLPILCSPTTTAKSTFFIIEGSQKNVVLPLA